MDIKCIKDPVIIIGMHRSGTTMTAKLLDRLGLFLGNKLESNHEALYFLKVNNEVLERINASWDNPGPMKYFLRDDDAVDMTLKCIVADLSSSSIRNYMGFKNYFKYHGLRDFEIPWGWKDPRNTFTIAMWLRLFPRAKVVYIVRNGVDVAKSLKTRELESAERLKKNFSKRFSKGGSKSCLERAGFKGSIRCSSLEGGFTLWEEYLSQAEETLSKIDNERLVVKYEDLLSDPETHIANLALFCGLEGVADESISDAAKSVVVKRSYAFTRDPALREFFSAVKNSRWMMHYGYSDAISSKD